MIRDLVALAKYMFQQEKKIAQECNESMSNDELLSVPGIEREEEQRILEVFPTLPESYLDVVRQYRVNGIYVGYMALSPFSSETLYESLMEAKECAYYEEEFMQENDFIIIGGQNEEVTCIAGKKSKTYTPGEIILISDAFAYNYPPKEALHAISKNFEDFMILAGNVNQVLNYQSEINDESPEKYIEEFTKVLKELKIDKKYWENWIGPRYFAGQ